MRPEIETELWDPEWDGCRGLQLGCGPRPAHICPAAPGPCIPGSWVQSRAPLPAAGEPRLGQSPAPGRLAAGRGPPAQPRRAERFPTDLQGWPGLGPREGSCWPGLVRSSLLLGIGCPPSSQPLGRWLWGAWLMAPGTAWPCPVDAGLCSALAAAGITVGFGVWPMLSHW